MSGVEVALITSLGVNVLFAVLVFRITSSMSEKLDRSHARTVEYTEDLLNRVMVRRWEDFAALKEQPVILSTEEIEEPELVPAYGPDRGGFGSRLGLAVYRPPDDEEIRPEEEMP